MKWTPSPGWMFVRKPEIDSRIGSLYAPESAVERAAGWQFEICQDGGPMEPEEDEEADTLPLLPEGSWILSPPRRCLECDEEGLLLMPRSEAWALIQ